MKELIQKFKEEHGHYPAAKDFDTCPYLPSARTVQRKYGGLVALKKELGIPDSDHRTGAHRKKMVRLINKRNNEMKATLTKDLQAICNARNIHHPFAPYDDSKINIDYLIYHPTKNHAIGLELFYPSSRATFFGCLNIKAHKLEAVIGHTTEFYYVVTNPDITPKEIRNWLANKKNPVQATGVIHISEVIPLLHAKSMV
jgi:hypothetical protein